MKGDQVNKWLMGLGVCILLLGCQKLENNQWDFGKNGTLNVETRSVENDSILYPMTLYAFSESGECVKSQTFEGSDEDVRLDLPSGKYRIVAVAGYTKGYVLPSVKSWDDEITLLADEAPETPMMIGMADVELASEAENKLEMLLSYSVAALDVSLSGIPSGVTEVGVTVSPFYASMNLRGEYKASDYSLNMVCVLDTAGRWTSPLRYVFPGSGEETVFSITFKMEDETKATYGYVWKEAPKANQPYHLNGSYAGILTLDGAFGITGWGQSEEVKFEFASTGESADGDDDANSDMSELPKVGDFWNGALVIDISETDDSGTEVLLMSLDEWDLLTSEVEGVRSAYSVNGISGWRLPTDGEAQLLKDTYSGDSREMLNERISAYDSKLVGIDGDERYLCLKADVFYSFAFVEGTKITKAGEKKVYCVRLMKSYRIDG